jgi:hypothetical protein
MQRLLLLWLLALASLADGALPPGETRVDTRHSVSWGAPRLRVSSTSVGAENMHPSHTLSSSLPSVSLLLCADPSFPAKPRIRG